MIAFKRYVATSIFLYLSTISGSVFAHVDRPWGLLPLEWKTEQIAHAFAFGGRGRDEMLDGKRCLTGGRLYFDVRDGYAFDIDEAVRVDIEFYTAFANTRLVIGHQRGDAESVELQLPTPEAAGWHRLSVVLEGARFANAELGGTDFFIAQAGDVGSEPVSAVSICKLALSRSHSAPTHTTGRIAIEVTDDQSRATAARLGIYDPTGRAPMPSDEAIMLKTVYGHTRLIRLGMNVPPWPVNNRYVFYIDGRYHSRVRTGDYQLIVAKGAEYRLAQRTFSVRAGETTHLKVKLERWTDMAAKGWYSGDDHIHHQRRDASDDARLKLFAQAEDLKLANILQMGNNGATYFQQHEWRPMQGDGGSSSTLVPGQEDPRTEIGHTIQLNIRKPIRNLERYFLYDDVFRETRAQGGLAGYAHIVEGYLGSPTHPARGMAIDVPFNLIDFAEILSLHTAAPSIWFDYLNLGYKISPTAGTDFPWGNVPGSVRNYVHLNQSFTAQGWFDELQKGHTFVTGGPMIEFTVNGQRMGSTISVKCGGKLSVEAEASLNPDFGALSTLELIEQGDVVNIVSSNIAASRLNFRHELHVHRGTWLVLSARGRSSSVVAFSAPVYIQVDGESSWKPSAVPSIVARLKSQMQEILELNPREGGAEWESYEPIKKHWGAQRGALEARIKQANVIYDDLESRAADAQSHAPSNGCLTSPAE